MMKRIAIGAMALLTGGAAWAQDTAQETKELRIGDKAPALEHVDWVKGEPVQSYRPGEVYVLDFWATWCGPCVRAIPHMNELAQEHKDDKVHVIGVAIWPSPNMKPTAEFVKEKGDAMSYLIAEDKEEGLTADAFMQTTLSSGIPTVMIINGEGKLAWLGHPMAGMDEALEQIIDGSYDLEAFAKKDEARRSSMREQKMLNAKLEPIFAKVSEAMLDGDHEEALALLDQAIAVSPDTLSRFHINKYNIALVEMKDAAVAKRIAADIEKSNLMEEPNALNSIAWTIADPDGPIDDELRDLDFALRLAEKADKLTDHKNPAIIDTVARVWFEKGDVAKAVELQRQAVAVQQQQVEEAAEGPQKDMLKQMKTSLEETLKEYEQATQAS